MNETPIDFVGEKDGDKLYIQVCNLLYDEKTIEREFKSLLEIRDNYPKFVLYKESSFNPDSEVMHNTSVANTTRNR